MSTQYSTLLRVGLNSEGVSAVSGPCHVTAFFFGWGGGRMGHLFVCVTPQIWGYFCTVPAGLKSGGAST